MDRIVLLGPAESVTLKVKGYAREFKRNNPEEVPAELQAELLARGRVPAEEGFDGPTRTLKGDAVPHRVLTMEEASRNGEQVWADPDDRSESVTNATPEEGSNR